MKGTMKKATILVLALLATGIYYYVTIPAVNIHSVGFWQCLLVLIAALTGVYVLVKSRKAFQEKGRNFGIRDLMGSLKVAKAGILLFLITAAVFLIGAVLSSPVVNASKYQKLLTVENSDFSKDIKEVSYHAIPLLDKNSAELLGNRKMGSMVDMVSQFEVSSEYTQINYQDTPVRVAPLVYASPIKWLTNQSSGIPAYIRIDMATQNTECVKLSAGIRYSESELFNRNIYRHLRFRYPTYIFDDQIFFEIDDEGTPYWVCPVKKFNIGLFGGQTIGQVILCNAITGDCEEYDVSDVPNWVDKVYSAELLTRLYKLLRHIKAWLFQQHSGTEGLPAGDERLQLYCVGGRRVGLYRHYIGQRRSVERGICTDEPAHYGDKILYGGRGDRRFGHVFRRGTGAESWIPRKLSAAFKHFRRADVFYGVKRRRGSGEEICDGQRAEISMGSHRRYGAGMRKIVREAFDDKRHYKERRQRGI